MPGLAWYVVARVASRFADANLGMKAAVRLLSSFSYNPLVHDPDDVRERDQHDEHEHDDEHHHRCAARGDRRRGPFTFPRVRIRTLPNDVRRLLDGVGKVRIRTRGKVKGPLRRSPRAATVAEGTLAVV